MKKKQKIQPLDKKHITEVERGAAELLILDKINEIISVLNELAAKIDE